jgi:hypothetical protein
MNLKAGAASAHLLHAAAPTCEISLEPPLTFDLPDAAPNHRPVLSIAADRIQLMMAS